MCFQILVDENCVKIFPHLDWIRRAYISPYSVRMRVNTDQNNFEYEHFFTQREIHWNISQECFRKEAQISLRKRKFFSAQISTMYGGLQKMMIFV